MLAPLLDALFPKRCAGCGAGAWPFCDGCTAQIVILAPPWCERCGAPAKTTVSTCADCPPDPIVVARAPYGFDGPVRRAIHRLKFAGWRSVANALSVAMAMAWESGGFSPQVIAWVPLSRPRLASRGYDQAKALAAAVAPRLGAPAVPLLRRVGDPGPQARRGGAARRASMRGVFEATGVPPPRVLVVDDVLTTGATGGACARALRGAGASEVGLLTAARAVASARRAGAPILGSGLASGSVVAPGNGSPAVDASRGRSDPRKPTFGR